MIDRVTLKVCVKRKRTFTLHSYESVGWSADDLPLCPHCHMNAYEADYSDHHTYIEISKEELEECLNNLNQAS